ncbi:Eco57I restriction-modification methylase domain-containing protein [Microbacterium sp. 22242]|uniref:Eco57I restriction-modification methylase domain-containing protein n=1 Tax=Microbacterium sp. 22242 TaxID=3453896 RepID=UPI003F841937
MAIPVDREGPILASLKLTGSAIVSWQDAPGDDESAQVFIGQDDAGAGAIQVGVAQVSTRPNKALLERLWKSRGTKAPMGFVVAAVAPEGVWVHYPSSDAPPFGPITIEQAERQLQSVLNEGNGLTAHARIRALQDAMAAGGTEGFTNQFLFASYYLNEDVPRRPDWETAGQRATPALTKRGEDLVHSLGFDSEPAGSERVLVLRKTSGPRRAVAVLLRDDEQFDQRTSTYQLTPVAKALEVAGREGVPWVIALRKSTLRLYSGQDGVGVGQRGQSETYFEIDLDLLPPEQIALVHLIFSAEALDVGGSVQQILEGSSRYAADLGSRLRDRVYEGVVPGIAIAIADRIPSLGLVLDAEGLQAAYRLAMRILFRLLFQAYGEATGLLPAGRNPNYDHNSLHTFIDGAINTEADEFSEESTAIWDDLQQVWGVIFVGNRLWDVPAYGGSLFDPSSEEGALLKRLELPDSVLGPALQNLLSELTQDNVKGKVDFRSLQVREFGTIYEGLLESSLSLAEQNLAVDKNGAYIFAKDGDEIKVPAGRPYFHSASGERKATGSYYTPKIVVDHLIERSVEPALKAHLDRIKTLMDEGKERQAADAFFDFRVADLAMGSAHFLVAAVDKIERGMRDFVTATEVPGVRAELARLAEKAREALGHDTDGAKAITEGQLLRRQVARRCIYGLDINPLAVELSQLALWIHTFVPGLPMSGLDHGLVLANSLTGIGTIDEAMDALKADGLFEQIIREPLTAARDLLIDYADASEADKSEVAAGADMLAKARYAAAPAKAIFDVVVAKRLGVTIDEAWDAEQFVALAAMSEVREAVDPLQPAHMPFLFPEVFLREHPGFDVIVGNPPWEKVRWEAAPFWAKVSPGLMALRDTARDELIGKLRLEHPDQAAREKDEMAARAGLQEYFKKAFTWRGGTHLELAQLMLERAMKSTSPSGQVGLVLPRQLLVLAGWSGLRAHLLREHDLFLVQARNRAGWLFEGVHASYAVVLLSAGPPTGSDVHVGVVTSGSALATVAEGQTIDISVEDLESYSDGLVVPWFDSPEDRAVFDKLRSHPRLKDIEGWVQGTHDARWDFRSSGPDAKLVQSSALDADAWRVLMTRHLDAYSLRAQPPSKQFVNDAATLVAKARGIVNGDAGVIVGDAHPRVIVRHPSRSDDTRTIIASALPLRGVLYNKGSVHAIAHASGMSPAATLSLLGLLNTVSLDWWARRFVDRHVTAPVVNNLPIPDWDDLTTSRVAALVAELLRRHGYSTLAGGVALGDFPLPADVPPGARDVELRDEIDALAAHGYGLTAQDLEVLANDFSESGLPRSSLAHIQELVDEMSSDD